MKTLSVIIPTYNTSKEYFSKVKGQKQYVSIANEQRML